MTLVKSLHSGGIIRGKELTSAIRVKAIKSLLPISLLFGACAPGFISCVTATCTGAAM
jgi:hypothetical protein